MEIRVWKYINDTQKQLIDLITSENKDFIKEMYKLMVEMYDFWNYEIEKIGF